MAEIKLEVIKEAALTNNCPECFNQGLKLSFFKSILMENLFTKPPMK
ncbi:hypothetical protein M601_016310 [Cellulophaga baltica 4]|nr:hypothetical protein M601_016310 [Cellulophaga baltica 4]